MTTEAAAAAVANATTAPGLRRAAIVMIQLGKDWATSVLSHLPESDVEAITAEIARLESVSSAETESVLHDFRTQLAARAHQYQGGMTFAQHLLEHSMGRDRAAEMLERISAAAIEHPFKFLQRADPAQLRTFIGDEHPQVIALVLAHTPPETASAVLASLSPAQQADVAHRIAVMDRTSPSIIRIVETTLKRQMSSMLQPATETARVGGVDSLVHIINRSDRSTERQIVEGLHGVSPELANEVRSRMFLFEDIVQLDDRSVQQVLRLVDANDLAIALKGVTDVVRDKITNNMSERASTNLMEEVDLLGAVRLRDVEEARQKIIGTIRQLEEQGQIIVRRGNDDEFVD